jgi:2-octaprenyl-6-methoxyphenol hydroxylase
MERYDVIILGSGLVGLTLGIALESAGLTVATIDAMPPEAALDAGFDGRASAIASASWRMLDTLGVADVLRPYGTAFCGVSCMSVRANAAGSPAMPPSASSIRCEMIRVRR